MNSPLKLEDQLCFALYSTMLGMNKVYRKVLRRLNLTYPQYLVMMVLWQQDSQTVSSIGERLFLESPTLTPLLKRLETRGLITRQRSIQDERQVIVTVTDEGKALHEQALQIPELVLAAANCSVDKLAQLKNDLVDLRKELFASSVE
ncbi:MarR family winged helix-turn-helix transcriptional regulator [Gynuella sp.]|uniref:MarR family winged helix-turn-helix transcriptional regulator n=1 Tax=Gynuella sp. TaxID=2969146 RepID=UPI003D114530